MTLSGMTPYCFEGLGALAILDQRQPAAEPATDTTPAPRPLLYPVATPEAEGVATPQPLRAVPETNPATEGTPAPRPIHQEECP